MKDNATLLAIGGVILMTLGVIVLSGVTGQKLDSELVKMSITGLVGFASGFSVAYAKDSIISTKDSNSQNQ